MLNKRLVGLVSLIGVVALLGCGRVEFYSDEKLEGPQTGVKFYYPKPYLLVARTGNKDKPVEISVIYLPDLSRPIYAKLKSGYGTADLSLAFQNGILTSVGQKTDTKIPETITALSSIPPALMPKEAAEPIKPPTFELYEIDNSSGTTVLKEVQGISAK